MTANEAKAIFLKNFPQGVPQADDFELRSIELDAPGAGEMLCRTVWMSVDPYMRGRMRPEVKSYIPPFSLDRPLEGGAVAEVLESHVEGFEKGDHIVDFFGGWKSRYLTKGEGARKVSADMAPLSAHLGVLGMPGMTAWVGIAKIIEPKAGETVFVSGAAGAVGSLACQLAKLRGARVIGSAGSDAKCDWLESDCGVDVAINYKAHEGARGLSKALAAAAPDGVHGYFENVGGDHLEAALNCIAMGGRIALCGMISQYNNQEAEPGPSNLVNMIGRGVMAQGFIVSNYMSETARFAGEVAPLLAEGKINFRETPYEGLEAAPDAFIGLFRGDNFGKAIVRVGPDRL